MNYQPTPDRSSGATPRRDDDLRTLLEAILLEQQRFRRLFEEFAGAYLNARFPFGTPRDRWRRRG